MTPDIIFVMGVISLGFVLFIFELFNRRHSHGSSNHLICIWLFNSSGSSVRFSNPAVVTIAFLFIISHALQKTRILEYLIVRVRRLADKSIILGRAVYLFTIGIASAVVNNTAIVAIFLCL